jgi:hypothetical protein
MIVFANRDFEIGVTHDAGSLWQIEKLVSEIFCIISPATCHLECNTIPRVVLKSGCVIN